VVAGLVLGWFFENRKLRIRTQIQSIQLELLKDTLERNGFDLELRPNGASTRLKTNP